MTLKHLENLWNDQEAAGMDEPELLRYRSNLLGSDLRLTNFGGGNTSAKVQMPDPITGQAVDVLWVKGSGGDLGSIKRDGFATLYMEKLLALKSRYGGVEEEDSMAELYPLCTFGGNPRAASIDTPLHGFLPFRHVDHLHPDWAIALAASANGQDHVHRLREETGLNLGWLPWKRPGFELGLWLEKIVNDSPEPLDGVILASHGLFTWGDTAKESYENTLRVIDALGDYVLRHMEAQGEKLFGGDKYSGLTNRPELPLFANRKEAALRLFPTLRGLAGGAIGHFSDSETVLRFVNSKRARVLAWQGTSCPDHFVRTRVRPLYPHQLDPDVLTEAVESVAERDFEEAARKELELWRGAFTQYAKEYTEYYEQNKEPDSPAMRGAAPTVVLLPGVGMFSFGKNKTEARITAEFYQNAINVMAGATSLYTGPTEKTTEAGATVVDNYVSLPAKEAFNIEYWSLEQAKLKRMPPEKEMSRKVVVLVGASPGIGRNVAERLLSNGAHVVLADINLELATSTVAELKEKYGKEVVVPAQVDVTSRESVRAMLNEAVLAYGGIDVLISIAAVFIAPDKQGRTTDEQTKKTYEINVLGQMILAEEASAILQKQGTKGSVVLVSSANAVVAKKGSVAYDTSKAALNHLVRELAIELSPNVRVNAVAPATVVEGSQMFPRDRTIASLAKYQIAFDESESTEALRAKLADFYAQRTLLKAPVSPAKVADAIYALATDRYSLTTGHVFPVDGGLAEAFLR